MKHLSILLYPPLYAKTMNMQNESFEKKRIKLISILK